MLVKFSQSTIEPDALLVSNQSVYLFPSTHHPPYHIPSSSSTLFELFECLNEDLKNLNGMYRLKTQAIPNIFNATTLLLLVVVLVVLCYVGKSQKGPSRTAVSI